MLLYSNVGDISFNLLGKVVFVAHWEGNIFIDIQKKVFEWVSLISRKNEVLSKCILIDKGMAMSKTNNDWTQCERRTFSG